MGRVALVAGFLMLAGCGDCLARCASSLTINVASPKRLPSYRFELIADGRSGVVTCRFDQPGETCAGFGMRVAVTDTGFTVTTSATPRSVTLVVTADTQSDRFDIDPHYEQSQKCSTTCTEATEPRTLRF